MAARPSPRARSVVAWLAAVTLGACGGGGGAAPGASIGPLHPELVRVEYGRLVDVYGLQTTSAGTALTLVQADVLVGPDIQDERDTRSHRPDSEVLYDFISADPETLQPRLFIPRERDGADFAAAFDALDDNLRRVTPTVAAPGPPASPYSVVPRNAAIRLTFSRPLGIDDSFFVERDAAGVVIGLRNTEAVQLLEITGDPASLGSGSALRPLPARIAVRGDQLVLDPVLLGSEGLQYHTRNNAAGLPESPDQIGANIRIALALDGPLAIPGLREPAAGLVGLGNMARRAIVRDFRSGNAADESADIARGFVRDPIPPRIVGAIPMYLERVETVNQFVQEITVFKHGVRHEIDRGDVFQFVPDNSGIPIGSAEVVTDPVDDAGQPEVQHVRVRVRFLPGLAEIDPRRLPGYPQDPAALAAWLPRHAPVAILAAEFSAGGRRHPVTAEPIGDDPRLFITFSPTALPLASGDPSPLGENISPFAGAVVRFTKPVDLATVRPADTFFMATRNLLDAAAIDEFIANRPNGTATPGMDPAAFRAAKYRTPHLIGARIHDDNGSQTAIRLQPTLGLYLDERMRSAPPGADLRYWVHMVSGNGGIRDLASNPVDLQADTPERGQHVAIPFTLDTRSTGTRPLFDDNLAVYVVRRFADLDEDEQPSYLMPTEVPLVPGALPVARAESQPLDDLFGSYVLVDGVLQGRPTTRTRQVADNLNQLPVAAQESPLRTCPQIVAGAEQQALNTAVSAFGAGIQNPHNPYGCRLQTIWREIDLSLSRTDPFAFDLEVEQMYWAPFGASPTTFDEFDRVSLFLGHCERRPESCARSTFPTPTFAGSGLRTLFEENYVRNLVALGNTIETQPQPHAAYADAPLTIDPNQAVMEPNRINRFMPLPPFRQPYFVFRDQRVMEQGGISELGSDLRNGNDVYLPFILSPWLSGQGRRIVDGGQALQLREGHWHSGINFLLGNRSQRDRFTEGLLGTVALPLLGDFWTWCDSPSLPAGNGYVALGTNGWQISLTVLTAPTPSFRVYSSGRPPLGGAPALCIGPSDQRWRNATGGFTLQGTPTISGDNSFYWVMVDFLKRRSVITAGFLDIYDPHRVPEGFADPRLGPFFLTGGVAAPPADVRPGFLHEFDPPASALPGGTSLAVEFRAAGPVDPDPWYWREWYATLAGVGTALQPTAANFPLDPYKAGDAHIRKFDDRRTAAGAARNWWTGFYNRNVTSYVPDPNTLLTETFLQQHAGANDVFGPRNVRYLNWRFLMINSADTTRPVAPTVDTFTLAYRFQRER